MNWSEPIDFQGLILSFSMSYFLTEDSNQTDNEISSMKV